jgi:hypothetical protein
MANMTSAIPDAINYLVDTFTADATLGTANPPVLILDGPDISQQYSPLTLWIGLQNPDDLAGNPQLSAQGNQQWAALGNRARYETFSVYCVAEAWSGVNDSRTARTSAFSITAAVETLVRTNASLGGSILVVLPGVDQHMLRQGNSSKGAVARVSFVITCKARLVSS